MFRRLEVPALVGPITQEQDTAAIKGVSSMYRYGMEVARVVRHIRVLDTAGYVDPMTFPEHQVYPIPVFPEYNTRQDLSDTMLRDLLRWVRKGQEKVSG